MKPTRVTSDVRRELILSAAKRCFARHGFAGTTTKSVAAAASISEALLFKHFPSKSALYAEILAEACEADAALHRLLGLAPSTATLVVLTRGMVGHFLRVSEPDQAEEAQRVRLLVSSQLDDGEFARLLYAKIGKLIGPMFVASIDSAIDVGDAKPVGATPLNLFWFAHHAILMSTLARLPSEPCLTYGEISAVERQLCEFILRGIGLTDRAISSHLDRDLPAELSPQFSTQAQPLESA